MLKCLNASCFVSVFYYIYSCNTISSDTFPSHIQNLYLPHLRPLRHTVQHVLHIYSMLLTVVSITFCNNGHIRHLIGCFEVSCHNDPSNQNRYLQITLFHSLFNHFLLYRFLFSSIFVSVTIVYSCPLYSIRIFGLNSDIGFYGIVLYFIPFKSNLCTTKKRGLAYTLLCVFCFID